MPDAPPSSMVPLSVNPLDTSTVLPENWVGVKLPATWVMSRVPSKVTPTSLPTWRVATRSFGAAGGDLALVDFTAIQGQRARRIAEGQNILVDRIVRLAVVQGAGESEADAGRVLIRLVQIVDDSVVGRGGKYAAQVDHCAGAGERERAVVHPFIVGGALQRSERCSPDCPD